MFAADTGDVRHISTESIFHSVLPAPPVSVVNDNIEKTGRAIPASRVSLHTACRGLLEAKV